MKGETPQTPREELEVRVTALLLGELPPEQAAALEAQIAADAELKSLHARLGEAIALVREASSIREQPAPAMLARLSNERRERLLKYFKCEVLPVVHPPPRRDWSWLRPLSLAAALIALIGGGLLLDGSFSRSIRSTDNRVVYTSSDGTFSNSIPSTDNLSSNTASEGTYWDRNSSSRGWWKESATRGERGRSNGDAQTSPATPADRFAIAKPDEAAKRPWYLAWAGQASPSNSPESDSGRAQSSRRLSLTEPAEPAAAAPVPSALYALPALEPAAGPASGGVPAAPPVLAGVELSRQSGRGGGGPAGTSQAVTSALGATGTRPLNESRSDFDTGLTSKVDALGDNVEVQFGAQPITGGFGNKPAQMLGREPALPGAGSQPATDMFAGGRAETYAFRAPVTADRMQRLETAARPIDDVLASDAIALNREALPAEYAPNTTNAFEGFGGIAGSLPAVRQDGVDVLSRSKGKDAESSRAGKTPYYRGRGINETGVNERSGVKVEQLVDASSSIAKLSKDSPDANGPKAIDKKTRFYQEQTLGKGLEAAGEMPVDGRAAGLEKNRAEVELSISNGAIDVAKLEATKLTPSLRDKEIKQQAKEVEDLAAVPIERKTKEVDEETVVEQRKLTPAVPQPEVSTRENRFSTFSLNVSDVSFKLAAASLENGTMPDPGAIRSEEFINAFDYRDPEPAPGAPLAFASERARYPFAQNRDLLRIAIKTAAVGRQPGRPLNVVLLVDNSGSMERADRVRILHEALRVLAGQLQPQDKLSIITFARTPRLWIDGVAGDKAGEATARISEITPQGGTNLSAALELGYQTALRHYQAQSINRVVLLTDGAANLGNVNAAALKEKVESHRKQGVALDCFGIGWEGYNDDLLEVLSRNGDGRYGFINSAEEAVSVFAAQLAGALRVAASDVKVQVEFNPRRVTAYRQVGYAKHQLTKEQFRDNTVDAAEIGAAEAGNGIYLVEVNPRGEGDLGTVRVRFKVPGTTTYREHEWSVPFTPNVSPLEQASTAMRLAGSASAFSELLAESPYAGEITTDALLGLINGVPGAYGADPRPQKLEWMIRQAKSLSGK